MLAVGRIDMAIDRLASVGRVAKMEGFPSLWGFETHRAIAAGAADATITASRP
jgi:hypothetical protein